MEESVSPYHQPTPYSDLSYPGCFLKLKKLKHRENISKLLCNLTLV